MQLPNSYSNTHRGFTLLEVMVVLLLIGIAVSFVMFNAFGSNYQEDLHKQTKRFQVVFDMASDEAILNQRQLGVRVEENQYHFVQLDDEQQWQPVADDRALAQHQLPENFSLELQLDGLPWQQEDRLFESGLFDDALSVEEDRTRIGEDEEEPPPPPQLFILSSGDITPFSLIFKFEPEFGDEPPVYFRVNGVDVPPLTVEGPLDSL